MANRQRTIRPPVLYLPGRGIDATVAIPIAERQTFAAVRELQEDQLERGSDGSTTITQNTSTAQIVTASGATLILLQDNDDHERVSINLNDRFLIYNDSDLDGTQNLVVYDLVAGVKRIQINEDGELFLFSHLYVTGDASIGELGTALGYFGTTPVVKQTVTGSTAGNAALQDLLAVLENYGLITDSTS